MLSDTPCHKCNVVADTSCTTKLRDKVARQSCTCDSGLILTRTFFDQRACAPYNVTATIHRVAPVIQNSNVTDCDDEPDIERVQALADISRSRCAGIATKPVQRLQIRPTLHNQRAPHTIPQSYIRVRAVVWACDEGLTNTDTHTDTQTP